METEAVREGTDKEAQCQNYLAAKVTNTAAKNMEKANNEVLTGKLCVHQSRIMLKADTETQITLEERGKKNTNETKLAKTSSDTYEMLEHLDHKNKHSRINRRRLSRSYFSKGKNRFKRREN